MRVLLIGGPRDGERFDTQHGTNVQGYHPLMTISVEQLYFIARHETLTYVAALNMLCENYAPTKNVPNVNVPG